MLEAGHLVACYVHGVCKGGFSQFWVYLRCGQGVGCENVVTLSKLERAVLLSEGEYCIAGDFNNGPEDLEPFVASIDGGYFESTQTHMQGRRGRNIH